MTAKVTTNSKDLLKELDQYVVDESDQLLVELETHIKADTPVLSGRARDGWNITSYIRRVGDTGILQNDVPYVIYLEEGHSNQAPQGFIETNIIRSLNERK